MKYISTRDKSKEFEFKDVFLKGLADDGGLFIPKNLKKFTEKELNEFSNLNYIELANKIIAPFVDDFISGKDLEDLISKSYSTFREKEVIKISNLGDLKLLELFHGPTLAFKDVAMQFIGNLYEYYLTKDDKKIKDADPVVRAIMRSLLIRLNDINMKSEDFWRSLNVMTSLSDEKD